MSRLEYGVVYTLPNGSSVAFQQKRMASVDGFMAVFQIKDKTLFQVVQERVPAHLLRSAGGAAKGEVYVSKFVEGKRRRTDDPELVAKLKQRDDELLKLEDKRGEQTD